MRRVCPRLCLTALFAGILLLLSGCGGSPNGVNMSVASSTGAVTFAQPSSGATVTSPVRFVVSAWSANAPVLSIRLLVDGKLAYKSASGQINQSIAIPNGTHQITAEATASNNRQLQSSIALSVSDTQAGGSPSVPSGPNGVSIPANAHKFTKIEEMSGWGSCTACAGANGSGPTAQYSMTQGAGSPSEDGSSAHFWLGGNTPFSAAIWFKQLGGNNNVRHFVYDLYYYMKDPGSSQALEFDVNQSTNNLKYIFGTQCDYKGAGHEWDVWDTANAKWVHTGVHCGVPSPNSWHHLTWELERTTDNHVHFVALTHDGTRHNINMYFKPKPVNAYEVNVAFQMDGDYAQHDYDVWLDQVSLYAW